MINTANHRFESIPCPVDLHVAPPLAAVIRAGVKAYAAPVHGPVAEVAKLTPAVFLRHVVIGHLPPLELEVLAGVDVRELATLPVAVHGEQLITHETDFNTDRPDYGDTL